MTHRLGQHLLFFLFAGSRCDVLQNDRQDQSKQNKSYEKNKPGALQSKLQEMSEELEHLKGPERKFYRHIVREIREMQAVK